MPYANRKEDKRSRLMKFANDIRSIYLVLAIFGAGMAWASDKYHSQYMTIDQHESFEHKKEIKELVNEVADLEIDLQDPQSESETRRIKKKLIRKKAQIRNLRNTN